MSDHGHAALSDWNFYINEWLRQEGYLAVDDATGTDFRSLLRRAGLTRDRLVGVKSALGLDDVRSRLPQPVFDALRRVVPPADPGSEGFDPDRVEWERTEAYSPDQNVVYLNAEETHPQGTVAAADAERTADEIEAKLRELDHPEPGRDDRLVTSVGRKEAVFRGPFTPDAPALVPIADDMRVTVQTGFNDGEVFARDEWSEHRQVGTLVTAGPSFGQTADVDERSILDVYPLVLELVDTAVPENADGEVPGDRLSYDPDPATRESNDGHSEAREYTDDEREEVRDQLNSLGYLE
jgi:predicted AlkP superfamily phosphohydrolase/phosphomutase